MLKDDNSKKNIINLKSVLNYLSTVISWTIFVLLIIIGVLLIYYYVAVKLYATKGEKFEPFFSIYTVASESMEPTIYKYDVIINTKVDDIKDVKVNDVITFISTWQVTYGMTITHRVVDTDVLDDGSICLVTRGDNNTQEDQACVTKDNLIGVVKAVIPGLGKVQAFLSSALGWFLIIILPALYVIVKDIIKVFNVINEDKEIGNKKKNKKDSSNDEKEKFIEKKELNKELEDKLEQAYQDLENVRLK